MYTRCRAGCWVRGCTQGIVPGGAGWYCAGTLGVPAVYRSWVLLPVHGYSFFPCPGVRESSVGTRCRRSQIADLCVLLHSLTRRTAGRNNLREVSSPNPGKRRHLLVMSPPNLGKKSHRLVIARRRIEESSLRYCPQEKRGVIASLCPGRAEKKSHRLVMSIKKEK